MLDLQENDIKIVISIFKANFENNIEVYAFGSRTKQTARKYFDLDLLIKAKKPTDDLLLCQLEEEFSESELAYKTDIIDWHTINNDFKQHITPQLIRIL